MFYLNFSIAVLISVFPVFLEKIKSKKFQRIFAPILICIIAIVSYCTSNIGRSFYNVSQELFDTRPVEYTEDAVQHLSKKNSDEFKNILVIASDARPNHSTDNARYDLMYIVQCSKASITIMSLERDTQVLYAGTNAIGNLNGSGVATGRGVPGLIDTIALNFGVRIDKYILVTWQNAFAILQAVYPHGYKTNLTEVEELAINEVMMGQNKDFGRDSTIGLLNIGDDENYYGIDVLTYLKDPMNFIVGVDDDGHPIDKNNNIVNVNEGMIEHIYEVNELIKGTPVERVFSSEEHSVTLDSYQALAYMRIRYCYASQNKQREKNVMNVMFDTAITGLPKLLSPQGDIVKQIADKTTIITSYASVDEIIDDFKISAIHLGCVKDGKRFYSIPYMAQSNELVDVYYSYKDQADYLLYEGD